MSKTETLRKFELVVIVDGNLTSTDKDQIIKEVADTIEKHGAKVLNSSVWIEKQKFTFAIQKMTEGAYYLISMEGDGSQNAKIETELKLNEKVLRFMVVSADDKQPAEAN